jgi:gas vesicle protein
MLPANFSPIGSYTDRQLDRARGYRLLAHAEIESYLEEISQMVITNALREWKNDNKPSNTIVAFLACYHSGWLQFDHEHNHKIEEIARSRKKIKNNIEEIFNLAQGQYIQILKSNHGVREKNFIKLISPTGVEIKDLDESWLTNLDDFGKKRGEIAHKTSSVTGSIDPMTEHDRIKDLLDGLKDLDIKLRALMN